MWQITQREACAGLTRISKSANSQVASNSGISVTAA
jgi:hypothetical protein